MGTAESRSERALGMETLFLKDTVNISCAYLNTDFPFTSPWVTHPQLEAEGIYIRIGVDSWNTTTFRKIWIQLATTEEVARLEMDPTMDKCATAHASDTNFVVMNVDMALRSSEEPDKYYELTYRSPCSREYIKTLRRVDMGSYILRENFANWSSGALILTVTVTLMMPVSDSPIAKLLSQLPHRRHGSPNREPCSCETLRKLLAEEILPDVKLQLLGGSLFAHRSVLAANSPVFRAMFDHDTKEKLDGIVDMRDIPAEVMALVLKCIYGESECTSSVDPVMLIDVMSVAERYELIQLKNECEDALISGCSVEPIQALLLADTHNTPKLRAAALSRIVEHPERKHLVNEAMLKEIARTHPNVALDLLNAII